MFAFILFDLFYQNKAQKLKQNERQYQIDVFNNYKKNLDKSFFINTNLNDNNNNSIGLNSFTKKRTIPKSYLNLDAKQMSRFNKATYPTKIDLTDENIATIGFRFQLFKVLRQIRLGQPMLVQFYHPELDTADNDIERNEIFNSISEPQIWMEEESKPFLKPLFVPGTHFSDLVGNFMISNDLCHPGKEEHYCPNLRIYVLTETGKNILSSLSNWWHNLTISEKIIFAFKE